MRGLYVITDTKNFHQQDLLNAVDAALVGGACMVQYREKRLSDVSREQIAMQLHGLCRERGAPLIVNDDVMLARQINADGVHLGIKDMDYAQARQILGPGKIIGVSCYADLDRAVHHAGLGADYVAFGRFFQSQTKPDAQPVDVAILAQAREILQIPLVAIGGITAENGRPLIEAGADMLAVVGAVFSSPDITLASQQLSGLFDTD